MENYIPILFSCRTGAEKVTGSPAGPPKPCHAVKSNENYDTIVPVGKNGGQKEEIKWKI